MRLIQLALHLQFIFVIFELFIFKWCVLKAKQILFFIFINSPMKTEKWLALSQDRPGFEIKLYYLQLMRLWACNLESLSMYLWQSGVTFVSEETERACKSYRVGPGWCGSVDWVPACKPEGHWFDSQSGHMPELQARSPLGQPHIDVSLSLFLPPFSSV